MLEDELHETLLGGEPACAGTAGLPRHAVDRVAAYAWCLQTLAPTPWFPHLLAASACVLLVAGCGASSEKKAVNHYFRQVSDVQREMLLPLSRINQAYRDFSLRPRSATRELPALTSAEQSIDLLRRRLATLEPPRTALRVHRLLLHLVDLERTTARELRGAAAYLPASQKALTPLVRANVAFRRQFAASKGVAAQARALDTYALGVSRADEAFRRVQPPELLRPSYQAQLVTLTRVRRVATRLAAALRANDRATVARLVPQFSAGASSAAGDGGAQARAIRRYDARVQEIAVTTRAIEAERRRLEQRLG